MVLGESSRLQARKIVLTRKQIASTLILDFQLWKTVDLLFKPLAVYFDWQPALTQATGFSPDTYSV